MITITRTPIEYVSKAFPSMLICAESDNWTLPDFCYVVYFQVTGQPNIRFKIKPDSAGNLLFDIAPLVQAQVEACVTNSISAGVNTITAGDLYVESADNGRHCVNWSVQIFEAYTTVASPSGVFIVDETSLQTVTGTAINCGWRFSDTVEYAMPIILSDTTFHLLSGIRQGWHRPRVSYLPPTPAWQSEGEQVVWIPVRATDWSSLAYMNVPGQFAENLNGAYYGSAGWSTPVNAPLPETLTDAGSMVFLGTGPQNMLTHLGLVELWLDTEWMFYDVWITDSVDDRSSVIYRYYRDETWGCQETIVRLAWWDRYNSAWNFWNFRVSAEEEYVERKQLIHAITPGVTGISSVPSNYWNFVDRHTADWKVIIEKGLVLDSGWIEEGEANVLSSLADSSSVYIVGEDGITTPVLITGSVGETMYGLRRNNRITFTAKLSHRTL